MANKWFIFCADYRMRRGMIIIIVLFTLGLSAFSYRSQDDYRSFDYVNVIPGERMHYRVHYGLINAAEGLMEVDREIHYQNGRPCFKVDVFGKTVGLFNMMYNVNDIWGSYIDTSAIIPHRSYRYIEEGRYRKYEIVDFDHFEKKARVVNLHKETRKPEKMEAFDIPKYCQDVVSGYYFFRTFNYDTIPENSIIEVDGFIEDTTYHMKIRFLGRDKLKTKLGEFDALVISPIMPKNKLFRGENSIKGWFSDDMYKIPLKIRANMFIGAIEVDIMEYRADND